MLGASLRRFGRITGWSFAVAIVGAIAGLLGVLAVVYALVYFGDDSNLKKATIMARINEETNIYMLDEQTPIGSIFSDAHRRYVPIDEVPAHMINALIAAEDKNFYNHHGIDPVAIVSAVGGIVKGNRIRGASTLTQQTARNILGWWDVTMSRKMKEAIAALQLERLYSKRQILEFYLNQFHVSGNGRGIGIAAKYYFNKDVRDLDLIESAFIAGSVKGPSQYDPFIKYTKERREKAIKRAYNRKNYVLRRMYEQGWISEEQFKEAWEKPVKFNRGSFRTDEVTITHLITQQLERKEIMSALGIEDPRDLSAAGLKVFSTIDGDLQAAGQLAVRRNLSRLQTILSGFKVEKPEFFRKLRTLSVNDFFFGQVAEITGTEKEPALKLTFGLPSCTVPYDSLMRYAKQVDLPWGRGWQKVLADMVKKIKTGDVLFVEVKDYDVEKHDGTCEMMKRPRVNGGLIALDKGEVRAVIPGFDSHGFNRSIQAKRQPGSVFKPVVFFAALQLGWNILDRLDNERQVFPFQGRFYYPHGDHPSPYKEVSIIWAGTTSENLASVNLASHLVDKLNFDQFKQLMGVMDLLPHSGEAPRDFHFRVARALGVQLDNDGVREYQLTNAVNDVMLDLGFSSTAEFQQKLKKMWWGHGYQAEMQSIMMARDGLSVDEKATKLRLADNNFLRLSGLDTQMVADWKAIETTVGVKGADGALGDPAIQRIINRFRVLPGLSKPSLGYVFAQDGERPAKDFNNSAEIERRIAPGGRVLNSLDVQAIWGGSALFGSANIAMSDVLLDGWLPHSTMEQLIGYVDKHYSDVMSRSETYDLNKYYQHHDFRIALGLNYLVNLARAMGVTSNLEPVPSFPLGTNVVSLAEVAKIYQTFVSGKTYRFYKEGPPNQINLIRRIEDRYGNVLFEPKRAEYQLVIPEFGLQMREVLRHVFTNGTGRSGRSELYVTLGGGASTDPAQKDKPAAAEKRILIPAFGKTGTTNDFNNANFAGFIPYPVEKGQPLDPENSYVIAANTAYDVNESMRAGAISVSGAIGALPAWVGLAKAIIEKKKYVDQLDELDLNLIGRKEWPLKADDRATPLGIDLPHGVVVNGGGDQAAVTTTDVAKEGESRFDEYGGAALQSTVRMPMEGGVPLRLFSPYKLEDQLKAFAQPKASSVTQPAGAQAADKGASADPKTTPDTRYYDKDGNRNNGAALAPAAAAGAAATTAVATPAGEATAQAGAAPAGAAAPAPVVDPMEVLKDLGNPDKDEGSGSAGDSDDAGYVEEELW